MYHKITHAILVLQSTNCIQRLLSKRSPSEVARRRYLEVKKCLSSSKVAAGGGITGTRIFVMLCCRFVCPCVIFLFSFALIAAIPLSMFWRCFAQHHLHKALTPIKSSSQCHCCRSTMELAKRLYMRIPNNRIWSVGVVILLHPTTFFCCERLSASMARSLHLSFICIPQSTRALDQGGVEPRQAVSPKALRPWTIPLRYSVG